MKSTLDLIHDMLVKLQDDVDDIRKEQIEQRIVLEEHQRRSLANEKAVEILSESVKPVEEHVLLVNFVVKIVSVVGAVLVVIATVLQAVK